MKQILIIILSIIGLGACKKQVPEPTLPDNLETAIVSFSIDCAAMDEVLTRVLPETDEKIVKDLNVYFFHKRAGLTKHLYITSQTNKFMINLVKGDYDLFVMANLGIDLSSEDLDFAEVKNYIHTISSEASIESSGTLVMSSYQQLSITGPTNFPISLERKIAKVQFNLTIAPSFAPDFKLEKIQVRNAASSVKLFEPSMAPAVISYAPTDVLSKFYLLENAQGINPNIKNQKEKNSSTAPLNATYIYIHGLSEGKLVEYKIFLGANNTTDFNILGNNHYIVDATISGINDIDTRVSVSELTAIPFQSKYNPGETAHSTLTLNCSNNFSNTFYLKYKSLFGDATVTIRGVQYAENSNITFLLPNENSKSIPVAVTTNSTTKVGVEFTATNQDGVSLTKELSTFFGAPSVIELHMKYDNIVAANQTIDIWVESSQPVPDDVQIAYEIDAQLLSAKPIGIEEVRMASGVQGVPPPVIKSGQTKSSVSTLSYKGSDSRISGIKFVRWGSARHNGSEDGLITYKIVL